MPTDLLRREDGAAMVEGALILPVLILLLFGLMEISLYFWNANLASKAVQLGLRRAIVSDAVAVGPGLDRGGSEAYWEGLTPGLRCFPAGNAAGPCPQFSVQCDLKTGCRCISGACGFQFAAARLGPILRAMQAVLPSVRPENVRIAYATNGLGYVGRPLPVPVDVTVSLLDMRYETLLLGDLMGPRLPLRASAQWPSEDLATR